MEWEGAEILIATVISLTGLGIVFIFLFIIFQKKKNYLIAKQFEAERIYENELKQLQFEIREQILRNISWELHDNIGQLLTLAKIKVQDLLQDDAAVLEVKDILSSALLAVRTLSRTINPEVIQNMSIAEAVQLEVDRINRMDLITSKLLIKGTQREIDPKKEIILFRIIQEFITNTLKHAKANLLEIVLDYDVDCFHITVKDDGQGFVNDHIDEFGVGLCNIKKRAALINSGIDIESVPGRGTTMTITNVNYE